MLPRMKSYIENTHERAKKIKSINKQELALALVILFSKIQYDYKVTAIINQHVRLKDDQAKSDILQSMLKNKDKPFYMASKHDDSAEDHKDWQGKLYYDEKTTDPDVLDYARKHNLRTLQWVTNKPVWFVTRPYCRHYFVQYSLEEVKKGVKPQTRKIGDRALQTPAHVTLNFYLDRLDQLERLYRVFPIPKLKRQIDKTKLLIKKWKKEI